MKTLKDLGEFPLIRAIRSRCRVDSSVVLGIGDDCAVLRRRRGMYELITADMLVENVHFVRTQQPEAVGHKLIACSLSDIAAMGGAPRHAVVSLGLPPDLPCTYVQALYRGMNRTAAAFGVSVVGGDTNSAPLVICNVTLTGEVEPNRFVRRTGARPGDEIFVTGCLGGSAAGRHLLFTPRVSEGRFLAVNVRPHAMIDISDGLLQDLGHITRGSGVAAVLEAAAIPVCAEAAGISDALETGEDFELLFTVAPAAGRKLRQQWPFPDVPLTRIGVITAGRGIRLRGLDGRLRARAARGFRHF
ncbi:MAG: thiamine-phosphate kinase [Candidatus Omnitrophica bacterium]|nr:thiamine-phosphate kinase [Candidatus Omnitrophota bacterium]